jgi:hypothetical protein
VITFTRMDASPDGETHFDDVTEKTTRVTLSPDRLGGAMTSPMPATDVTFLRMDAGYDRDLHPAPRRQLVFVSAGELEVTVSDGESRRFGPGSMFLAEDTTGKGHQTWAVGSDGCSVVWVACQ